MPKRVLGIVLLVCVAIGIAVIAVKCKPNKPVVVPLPDIEEPITIEPEVVYITKPGKTQYVYVNDVQHEVATMDTLLVNKDKTVSVDLGIRYDTYDKEFGVRSVITHVPTPVKSKWLRPTMSLDVGWDDFTDKKPDVAGIGLGVKVKDRISVMGTYDTKNTVGVRLGVDL